MTMYLLSVPQFHNIDLVALLPHTGRCNSGGVLAPGKTHVHEK
jgi:hypothetical protein